MGTLDWWVLVVYIGAMIGLSLWLARGQEDEHDYYVGGRKLPWWAVGISVVATQSSAISFISIPAFVALRPGGGLTWLQYELAVPLALLFLVLWVVPFLRRRGLISVFEYLLQRFGRPTSRTLAVVFLISRGLATGVGVFATALVLAPMLEWSITATVLLIGVVAVVYDTIGGLKAVVASDVIQLGMMFGGVAVSVVLALNLVGGWDAAWEVLSPERRAAADFRWGVGDDATAPFWAYLIGGWFLYASVYGTDQSYVQRLLATKSPKHAQWSLMLGGFVRLPLTLMYIALGISIGAVLQTQPELQAVVPADRADLLVPQFILLYVPVGLKGLILAAILAAAMSSLDSSLNSLSAVTVRDILPARTSGNGANPRRELWLGKITTLVWGAIVTGAAFLAGSIDRTVIEAINKIGSAFYGPVLATFCLGLFAKRIGGAAMMAGILIGVAANLALWLTAAPVHWMWWNLVGFALAVGVAWLASLVMSSPPTDDPSAMDGLAPDASEASGRTHQVAVVSLLAVFVLTVGLVVGMS